MARTRGLSPRAAAPPLRYLRRIPSHVHLPRNPYEAYAKGAVKDIEILHGCNKDEMNYFVHLLGSELFEMWTAERKTRRISALPDEDKERILNFLNSVEGENYEKDSCLFSQLWFNASHIRLSAGRILSCSYRYGKEG